MEKFEFKIDVNTPYIKIIRFLGTALFGFYIGSILFTLKFDGDIDWMNSTTGLLLSLVFAFFPGATKKQALTIDDAGIYLHHYTFHWGQKKEIAWEKIKGILVQKNMLVIKNSIGSSEKIKLPLHTKQQIEDLKSYLNKISEVKEFEYLN